MRHYEYRCPSCGEVEEHYRRTEERDDPVACSACGAQAERLLSAFVATGPTPIFNVPLPEPPPQPQLPAVPRDPKRPQRRPR